MNNLQSLLNRRSEIRGLLSDLEEEYQDSGLPKGKSYNKRRANYLNSLLDTQFKLNKYGKGEIHVVTLIDEYGIYHTVYLTIPKNEVGLYIETFFPGYTIYNKLPLKLGVKITIGNLG